MSSGGHIFIWGYKARNVKIHKPSGVRLRLTHSQDGQVVGIKVAQISNDRQSQAIKFDLELADDRLSTYEVQRFIVVKVRGRGGPAPRLWACRFWN